MKKTVESVVIDQFMFKRPKSRTSRLTAKVTVKIIFKDKATQTEVGQEKDIALFGKITLS